LKPLGFGHCYDILALDEKREFQYVDDILYVALNVYFDDNGKYLRLQQDGQICKYTTRDGYTLVYSIDLQSRRTVINIITPVGNCPTKSAEKVLQEIRESKFKVPVKSTYYCLFTFLIGPDSLVAPVAFIHPEDVPETKRFVDVKSDDELSIRCDPNFLEWMYKAVCKDRPNRDTNFWTYSSKIASTFIDHDFGL